MLGYLKKLLRPDRHCRAGRSRYFAEPLEQRVLLTRLAVLGDYSSDLQTAPTRDVSNLIKSWNPDAVVTAGDNNYPGGEASTIDANIGQWYHQFIYPYTGSYGSGSADGQNHFWPTLGNHDWDPGDCTPYTDYFTLPNNERYYTVQVGNIALFIVDSESPEPDGISSTSTQANWIKSQMLASTAPWKLVLFHEPYYSSGPATNSNMNWPFASWGATAVITGHDHQYERLSENGLTYFVDGLGGESIFDFSSTVPGSQIRYNADYGALRVDSTSTSITFSFITRTGQVIDTYTIGTPVPNPPMMLQASASPGQIALSWSASSGATSYRVYRGTSPGGESITPIATNLTGTSFTDTNVTSGPTYYYEVTAVNGAGESAMSVEASASLAPPAIPPNPLAQGGIKQIALTWGASSGAASYNIYRGTAAGAEGATAIATGITATTFTNTNLTTGSTFYYKVSAVNGLGESGKSSEASSTVVLPPAHIVVVIESHYNTMNIISEGNTTAPYINSLADGGALFSLAHGVTYPGQPNYLALFSGSTQGVTSDTVPSSQFTAQNLGSELITAGLTFTGYAQGLPSAGSLVNSSGAYFRYHNPWSEFSNVPAVDNQPFTAFPTNFSQLPTISFVVPDFNNDMHDGTITQADTWLQTNLGAYATWATTHNSLLIVTWDDNDSGSDPNNPIATIIYGQQVQIGTFGDSINHYNVLRTIEDLYGLPRLGSAATAFTIQDSWHAVPQGPAAPTALVVTSGGAQQIGVTWAGSTGATGYNVYRGTSAGGEGATPVASNVQTASFNDAGLMPGVTYYYQVTAVNASGESGRSNESSAATAKATPVFGSLSASSSITYGTATVTLSGTLTFGTLVPPGSVTIAINGSSTNAAINSSTGAFSTNFDTHAIPASASAYTITYSYAATANYNAASDTSTTLTVNKRSLHVAATGVNKVYDGLTIATVTPSDDHINGDAITTTYTAAAFVSKNVGTGVTVNVSGISFSGAAAGNYTLANTTAATIANITPRTLHVTATGQNKVYDGNAAASVTFADDRVAGDTFSVAAASISFANKNVGNGKIITVSGISISGTDAPNYTANTSTTASANITQRSLTITATGQNKTYDGTTTATVTLGDNRVAGDSLTPAYTTATFADKNVGNGKTITVSGISISGTDAPNYTVNTSTTASANITSRALTVTASGQNKVYDGTTTAAVTLGDNRVSGDSLTPAYTTATFADKNVGSGKTITVSGISISGTDASNYTVNTSTTASANIAARALTVTATGQNKIYDGTTTATVTLGDNRIAGDGLTTAYASANFVDKNVANGKTINVSGISISGTDASNYTANTSTTSSANITARALTITATGQNKVYDGTDVASVTLTDNRVAGDFLASGYSSATFADKNVGTGKTITVSGISISGADAPNYTGNTSASATADITQRSLTVTATGQNKVYDGTMTAGVTVGDNRVAGDTLNVSYITATFADKNVGAGKLITVSGISISGADVPNYIVNTSTTASANITPKALTIAATGQDKVYDGTTTATVILGDNRVAGDALTTSYASAAFPDKNVGAGKSVSVWGITLGGADAGNYTFNTTTTTSANITARGLTVTATALNKVYDGATSATVTLGDNRIAGDSLTPAYASAAFADANVGTGKPVTISGITLSGTDSGNYTFNTSATATANITPLALTASGIAGNNKVYDGTTTASVNSGSALLLGVLNNDDVSLNSAGALGTFALSSVGNNILVSVSGLTLAGSQAGNYMLMPPSTSASITPLALTVSGITANDKPYDGATAANLDVSGAVLVGVVGGDVVTLNTAAAVGTFASANVAANVTVNVSGLSISGAASGNYTVTEPTTTASITPELLISGTAGADAITLVQDADHLHVDWYLNGAAVPGQLTINNATGLTILGNGGADVIVLDYTNGNPLPANLHLNGTFTLSNLQGTNPLAGTTVEVGKSTVLISYSAFDPIDVVRTSLGNGYNGGTWDGVATPTTGSITSAAAKGNMGYMIGYADSSDGVVAGQPLNTIELKYTLGGDLNLSGTVNFSNFATVVANYGNPAYWDGGAISYGATVSFADFSITIANYDKQATPSTSTTGAAITSSHSIASSSSQPSATRGTTSTKPAHRHARSLKPHARKQ
jgi:hypothetical protein